MSLIFTPVIKIIHYLLKYLSYFNFKGVKFFLAIFQKGKKKVELARNLRQEVKSFVSLYLFLSGLLYYYTKLCGDGVLF